MYSDSRTDCGRRGNLLLNVAPMFDGRMEQRQLYVFREIGDWLKINGESIYGTKGGPFKPTNWMVSTYKNNKIYIHLLKWREEKLVIPKFSNLEIQSVSILMPAKSLCIKLLMIKLKLNCLQNNLI